MGFFLINHPFGVPPFLENPHVLNIDEPSTEKLVHLAMKILSDTQKHRLLPRLQNSTATNIADGDPLVNEQLANGKITMFNE